MAYYVGSHGEAAGGSLSYWRNLYYGKGILVFQVRIQGDDAGGTLVNYCKKRVAQWAENCAGFSVCDRQRALTELFRELEEELQEYGNSRLRRRGCANSIVLSDVAGCISIGKDCLVFAKGKGTVGILNRYMEKVRVQEGLSGEKQWSIEYWELEEEIGLLFTMQWEKKACAAAFGQILHPGSIRNSLQLENRMKQVELPGVTVCLVYTGEEI